MCRLKQVMRAVLIRWMIFFAVAVLLAGCGTTAHKQEAGSQIVRPSEEAVANAVKPVALPFPEPKVVQDKALTPDIVYSILVAELAIQRGDPELAYSHYMYGASLSGDARAAQQATRIATSMRDVDRSIAAVERWIALAPNALQARATAVMLYLQAEQLNPATEHLGALIKISRALGQDGFMRAVTVVSRSSNQQLGLQAMQRLVGDYPDEQQAHYALALVAVAAKEYAVAEREIRSLLDRYPDRARIYILLSNVLYSQGSVADAEHTLEKALADEPENRLLLTAYARILMKSQKLQLAYEQFQKIERLMPEDPDVLYTLGILSIELQRLPASRRYLQRLIDSKKGNRLGDATYFMGRTYEVEGRPEEALLWYERVSSGEYVTEARTRIARLLALSGEVEKAREMLQQLRATMPHHAESLFLAEGEILQELKLYEDAIALCSEALERYPESHSLRYLRAMSAASLNQLDLLERDLTAILQKNPEHADALNALGYTLADQTDRYQEALGYIQRALALQPDAPAIIDSMGWVQYRLGNYTEALRYLRQAMEKMPDPEVAAHLGEVLWVLGEQEEAAKIWKDAVAQHPENRYLLDAIRRFNP